MRFLEAIPSLKSRTALTTVYAAGLRVSEVVLLKITDIDSQRMVIRVEQGKGGKDHYVMFSPQLLTILRTYLPTALLANPPSNMLCRSIMLNGHAPRCCIVDGHRRPMQSSIAAGTGGQTAHCSLPPSEPAPRSRLRQSHYPHSAQPSAASFNPASVRSHSRHRPCLRCDLTEPSRFTNQRRSDSRWQTEDRLP